MRKVILLFTILPTLLFSQSKSNKLNKEEITKTQVKEMVQSIPVVDGKILYDHIIETDSTETKEMLFVKIRQWFVENFVDSKAVFEVNDLNNGLLTGKGIYNYSRISGLNKYKGSVLFLLNVAVKDGKFRYQLSNFHARGYATGMLGDASTGKKNEENLDEMVEWYHRGKRKTYSGAYLEDMVKLVYFIDNSLADLSQKKASITDF